MKPGPAQPSSPGTGTGSRGVLRPPETRPSTFKGTLAEGESRRITLVLQSRRSYSITGECDSECDDLDFVLRRGTTVVDDDTASDADPFVEVTPNSVGTYSLEVRMESCSQARCSYTVEIEED